MFCMFCGKPISEGGQFCPHCGKPLKPSSQEPTKTSKWEYKYFSMEWGAFDGGKSYKNESLSRLFFWESLQTKVLPSLQHQLDNGWEPITEVGPASVVLDKHGDYFGIRAIRIKLRKQRTTPLLAYEQKIIGKWHLVETKKKNLLAKFVFGLGEMFNMPINLFEFSESKIFIGKGSYESNSGTYVFADEENFTMISDPPKIFTQLAKLSKTGYELVMYSNAVEMRFQKSR